MALSREMLDAITDYCDRGWYIVPLRGKVPIAGPGWQHNTSNDIEENVRIWGDDARTNIGLQLGPKSGVIDIEFDSEEGKDTFQRIVGESYTPSYRSGRSVHRLYQYDARLPQVSSAKPQGLECRIGGGGLAAQSVMPPSLHHTGVYYRWLEGFSPSEIDLAPVPESVIEFLNENSGSRNLPSGKVTADGDLILSAGERYPYARTLATQYARDGLGAKQIERLLLGFFSLQPEPADAGQMRSLAEWAVRELGVPHVDLSGMDSSLVQTGPNLANNVASGTEPEEKIVGPPDPGPPPAWLMEEPTGFIQDVIQYNLRTAPVKQPWLALAAALALQGTLCARKVVDTHGMKTGLYYIATAPSARGKNHALDLNCRILEQGGAAHLIAGQGIESASGLLTAAEASPSGLFQVDEVGDFFKASMSRNADAWRASLPIKLMELFSAHNRVYMGPARADASKTIKISYPCVSLYATGTPEPIYQALSSEQVVNGFISRILWFEGDPEAGMNDDQEFRVPIPGYILDTVEYWDHLEGAIETGGPLDLSDENFPEKLECKIAPSAVDGMQRYRKWCEDQDSRKEYQNYRGPWLRAREKAQRLAMIYACSANPSDPVVGKKAAKWATSLASYLTKKLLYNLHRNTYENEYDGRKKKIHVFIKDAGTSGRTRTAIGRKFGHYRTVERQEMLGNLVEGGYIREVIDGNKGVYYAN